MSSSTQDQELVSSLKLVKFSEELCRSKIISKEVKDTFASLDHDRLDSGLKVRYLLHHIRKSEENDATVLHRFLEVLDRSDKRAKLLSRCIRRKLCEFKTAVKIPGLYSSLTLVYQTIDTVVAKGKTSLLEVQVSPCESACYQWMKNGKPLSDNAAYSGACSDILVIRHASHCADGVYTCCVSKGDEEVISDEVVLTVKTTSHAVPVAVVLAVITIFASLMINRYLFSVPPEKKHLLTLYSKNTEVPPDSWPPPVTTTFINLAVITKKKQDTDSYDYAVRGDMDDVLESKEAVSYEEVFGKYERGGLVLVEGRPGSGKTTLLHKLTRDWAIRGDMLKNAKMVFLISLRSLANRKAEKLSDILELFYDDHEDREKVSSDIKRSDGEGMCFVIDGLDEYHSKDENNSVIHQLLYETKYLPEAMVIVASRPVASSKLKRTAPVTRRIEVLGFTKQQIFEYIVEYPFSSDISKSGILPSNLTEYLNSHLNILHICYLPVHAAMICFLYEKMKGDIPHTETKIYEHFTRFMLLRKLTRSNELAQLHSLEDLRGKDKEYFRNISQLAFVMTSNSKQVVYQEDTEVRLSPGTRPDDAPSLGLVTIDRTAQLYGFDNTYAFLHLTFQEYLAAFYLSKFDDEKQMDMIRLHAGEKHMRMVWKFYCGIVNFENKVAQINEIMRTVQSLRHEDAGLYEVQCAFESQQRVVCDSIVERRTGVLNLDHRTLSPTDLTALGYVISTTSLPVTRLAMEGCHLSGDHIRVFLREVSSNKLKCIQTLQLSYNNIGDDGAVALAEGLKFCTNLQTLELIHNNISDMGVRALAEGLKNCVHLQTLELIHNNIGDEGARALAEGLKNCIHLQTLGLSENNIGDDGEAALAEKLKHCTKLRTLWLTKINDIDDYVAVA